MHDLLRAYAAHLAAGEETAQQRQAAPQRLLGYYQAATVSATNTLYPANASHMPEVVASITPIPGFADPDSAYAWLEDERFCLVAAAAKRQGLPQVVGGQRPSRRTHQRLRAIRHRRIRPRRTSESILSHASPWSLSAPYSSRLRSGRHGGLTGHPPIG
ncbi:hypothetical protein [Plantactinospora sp. ZYX-F-223]|uniref:hypothetical protein n=1 Tax=Plantactinospora sp. ZYX-F-223 TaxID=3144103 RepID=UPI0031FDDC68